MENINLSEVSLVDHPAHMVEGFAVIKSQSPETNRALFSALRKETMPEKTLAEMLNEASADDIRKALTADKLLELVPVAEVEVVKAAPTDEEILKALPAEVRERIEKAEARASELEAQAAEAIEKAAKAEDDRLNEAAITKSKEEYTNLAFAHETVAPALRKFADENPEAAAVIVEMMKAVNEQADGAIFTELGTSAPVEKGEKTANDKLVELAKARETKENVPFSKAYIDVVNDPANAELVTAHFKENN